MALNQWNLGNAAIAGACTSSFLATSRFDFRERFYVFSRNHEKWEVDEFATILLYLVVGLLLFLGMLARELRTSLAERNLAEESARHLARHDPLTGIANRRTPSEALDRSQHLWAQRKG